MRLAAFGRHYTEKLLTMTLGAASTSTGARNARRLLDAVRPNPAWPPLRLAVVAHLYYVDLLHEVLTCRAVLPHDVPLHLTVPEDRIDQAAARLEGVPATTLHAVPNRGRDVAPFLGLLSSGALDDRDAVLKIHGKRSPHLRDGDVRRRMLFSALCGSGHATARALHAFTDPRVGMVGWRACFRSSPVYWMANEARMADLAARMGAAEVARLGFFEGSMFWFRPAALARLRGLSLQPTDFEPEAGQTDGALHHAVERCFTIACWAAGYEVRDLRGKPLLPGDEVARRWAQPSVPAVRDGPVDQADASKAGATTAEDEAELRS